MRGLGPADLIMRWGSGGKLDTTDFTKFRLTERN